MNFDWKSIGIVALVVMVSLACMTMLAVKGLIAPTIVTTAATGAIGWFTGWMQPSPKKDELK